MLRVRIDRKIIENSVCGRNKESEIELFTSLVCLSMSMYVWVGVARIIETKEE